MSVSMSIFLQDSLPKYVVYHGVKGGAAVCEKHAPYIFGTHNTHSRTGRTNIFDKRYTTKTGRTKHGFTLVQQSSAGGIMIKFPNSDQCLVACFFNSKEDKVGLCGSKLECRHLCLPCDLGKIRSSQLLFCVAFCSLTEFQGQDLGASKYGSGEVWCKFARKTLVQQAEERQKSDLVVQYDWYSSVFGAVDYSWLCSGILVYLVHTVCLVYLVQTALQE